MHLVKSQASSNGSHQPTSSSVFYDDLPPEPAETAPAPVMDARAVSKSNPNELRNLDSRRNMKLSLTRVGRELREGDDDVVHCVRAEVVPVSPTRKLSPAAGVKIKAQLLPSLPSWRPREDCLVLPEKEVSLVTFFRNRGIHYRQSL
jgi:hypothetical protein